MASAADHRAAADAQFTGSNVFDDGASRGGPDTDSSRSSRIALIDGGLCEIQGAGRCLQWDETMEVCVAQFERKAAFLNFNFDSDLIDGQSAMGKFMRMCLTEPNVAKLPFMIGSSK